MAHELEIINGVTRYEKNGDYIYNLGNGAVIYADTNRDQYFYYGEFKGDTPPVLFSNITDKLGASNIVEYIDNAIKWGE